MESIENIWSHLHEKLKAFVISKINDQAVAEDILQEVFVKIHLNIGSLNDETKVRAWIYQITRNLISDHYRKVQKEKLPETYFSETEEENLDREVMDEAVNDLIKMMYQLPPENCEALCLTELEGLSQIEYAQKAGISYTAAKARVQRSRRMLKDMLMNCCHYQFDKYGTVLEITPNSGCCCCCHDEK